MKKALLSLILVFLSSSQLHSGGKMYSAISNAAHCTAWDLNRILGKKSKCKHRAKLQSRSEINCRLKKTALNKNDSSLTDCIYERAGYRLGTTTVSLENNGICPRTIRCKRW